MSRTFQTARGTRTVIATTPEELREQAEKDRTRALDNLRRADENAAEADRWEAENVAHAEQARVQRRERSAATRARNAYYYY